MKSNIMEYSIFLKISLYLKDMLTKDILLDEISQEQQYVIDRIIYNIYEKCPSDANVLFRITESNNCFVGELEVCSLLLKMNIREDNSTLDSLLELIDLEFKEQILKWRSGQHL